MIIMSEKLLISELYPIVGRSFLPTISVQSHLFKNPNHSSKTRWFVSVFMDEEREFHWATFHNDNMLNIVAHYNKIFTKYITEKDHIKRVQILEIAWADICKKYLMDFEDKDAEKNGKKIKNEE